MKKISVAIAVLISLVGCGGSGVGSSSHGTIYRELGNAAGTNASKPLAISNSGVIVGEAPSPSAPLSAYLGIIWTGSSGQTINADNIRFQAISPDGNWVGGCQTINSVRHFVRYNRATRFLATSDNVDSSLGSLHGARVITISNTGAVEGFAFLAGGAPERFCTWTESGAFSLGDNAWDTPQNYSVPSGTYESIADSFSSNKQYITGNRVTYVDGNPVKNAMIWNVTTKDYVQIPNPTGAEDGRFSGLKVSDDGQTAVIGGQQNGSQEFHFLVWKAGSGLQDVMDLLHSNGFASSYTACSVTGLSADGKTICGTLGTFGNTAQKAFMFRMP